ERAQHVDCGRAPDGGRVRGVGSYNVVAPGEGAVHGDNVASGDDDAIPFDGDHASHPGAGGAGEARCCAGDGGHSRSVSICVVLTMLPALSRSTEPTILRAGSVTFTSAGSTVLRMFTVGAGCAGTWFSTLTTGAADCGITASTLTTGSGRFRLTNGAACSGGVSFTVG